MRKEAMKNNIIKIKKSHLIIGLILIILGLFLFVYFEDKIKNRFELEKIKDQLEIKDFNDIEGIEWMKFSEFFINLRILISRFKES